MAKSDRLTGTVYTPPGFYDEKDLTRSHLIANMLGGSNTDPRNIALLCAGVNQSAMKRYEYEVARRLGAGETAYHAVTPVYNPEFHSVLPKGINLLIGSQRGVSSVYIPNTR